MVNESNPKQLWRQYLGKISVEKFLQKAEQFDRENPRTNPQRPQYSHLEKDRRSCYEIAFSSMYGQSIFVIERYLEHHLQNLPEPQRYMIRNQLRNWIFSSLRKQDSEYAALKSKIALIQHKTPEELRDEILQWMTDQYGKYTFDHLPDIWSQKYNLPIHVIIRFYSEIADKYWESQRLASEYIINLRKQEVLTYIEPFFSWLTREKHYQITKNTVKGFLSTNENFSLKAIQDHFYHAAKAQFGQYLKEKILTKSSSYIEWLKSQGKTRITKKSIKLFLKTKEKPFPIKIQNYFYLHLKQTETLP